MYVVYIFKLLIMSAQCDICFFSPYTYTHTYTSDSSFICSVSSSLYLYVSLSIILKQFILPSYLDNATQILIDFNKKSVLIGNKHLLNGYFFQDKALPCDPKLRVQLGILNCIPGNIKGWRSRVLQLYQSDFSSSN